MSQVGARLNRFARGQRVSTKEAMQRFEEAAQEVFDRQVAALVEEVEAGPDEGGADEGEELENMLAEDGDEEDGSPKRKGKTHATQLTHLALTQSRNQTRLSKNSIPFVKLCRS